ncbi:hypothetical protein PG995_005187 [Apiospora arundinis]
MVKVFTGSQTRDQVWIPTGWSCKLRVANTSCVLLVFSRYGMLHGVPGWGELHSGLQPFKDGLHNNGLMVFVTSQFEELFAISLAMAFMMMMLFSCFRLFILGQYYVDRDERRDRSRASGDAGYRDTGLSWRQPMGGHGEQAIGQAPCWKNELAFRELPSTVIQVLIAMPSAYALTGLQP